MTISKLAMYERTYCSCGDCRSFCRTRPGALAPGDIDAIAEHLGLEYASASFIAEHMEATQDGPRTATPEFPDGRTPAMRPKMVDGKCVFLGDDGKCKVHPVAPFECSRHMACRPDESGAALKALGKAIVGSRDYIQLWMQSNDK